MNKALVIFINLLLSQNVYSQEIYPKEISNFIEKRDHCDYLRKEFSGEPKIDNVRSLPEALNKYCKETDKQLSILKNKYRKNQVIIDKLSGYEESIEPDSLNDELAPTAINYKFSNYPAKEIKKESSEKYTANFAGHYVIKTMGCGGGAICGSIINVETGKTIVGLPNAYLIEEDGKNPFEMEYRVDSYLLIISGIAADSELDTNKQLLPANYRTRYYALKNNTLVLLGIREK